MHRRIFFRPTLYFMMIGMLFLVTMNSCSNNDTVITDTETAADPDSETETETETEPGETGTETGTDPTTIPVMASIPADLMENCNQWKITYPDGGEEKELCDEDNNEYFFVNEEQDGIVFKVPIRSSNGTTPNSSFIRSELRERTEDGSSDKFWTTQGKHVIYVKQAFTHLPINKDEVVGTQIHGDKEAGIDDAMVLRLEGNTMFLSFNGKQLRSDVGVTSDYILGTVHEVIFEVIDNKHYCYYSEDGTLKEKYENGDAASYLVSDNGNTVLMDLFYEQAYFKVGNYTQTNADREGSDTDDEDNYGEVVAYDFYVTHSDDN